MQCKDIPTLPILEYLAIHGGIGCNWYQPVWNSGGVNEHTVQNAMPEGLPRRLIHAKMRQLMHHGLVGGCDCGCRGDFELTDKGREMLKMKDNGVAEPCTVSRLVTHSCGHTSKIVVGLSAGMTFDERMDAIEKHDTYFSNDECSECRHSASGAITND